MSYFVRKCSYSAPAAGGSRVNRPTAMRNLLFPFSICRCAWTVSTFWSWTVTHNNGPNFLSNRQDSKRFSRSHPVRGPHEQIGIFGIAARSIDLQLQHQETSNNGDKPALVKKGP